MVKKGYKPIREQFKQIEDIHSLINRFKKKKQGKIVKELEKVLDTSIKQLKIITANDVTEHPGIRKRNIDVKQIKRGSYHNPFNLKVYVACLDIDDFGKFNKKHGDREGDKLLRLVGDSLFHSLRSKDVVLSLGQRWDSSVFKESYHLHGDEFQIIFMTPNLNYAVKVIKRCKKNIIKYVGKCSDYKISVSVGIVEWDVKKESFEASEHKSLVSRNIAKKRGRNLVVCGRKVV